MKLDLNTDTRNADHLRFADRFAANRIQVLYWQDATISTRINNGG